MDQSFPDTAHIEDILEQEQLILTDNSFIAGGNTMNSPWYYEDMYHVKKFLDLNDDVMFISLAYDTDNSGEPDLFKLYKVAYTQEGGWFYIRQLVAEEKNEYGRDYGLFSMSSRSDFQ